MQDDNWTRLQSLQLLREHVFHSDLPVLGRLIAGFRALWNSISTRWYVRPVIQQQSEFNSLVVAQLLMYEARQANQETLSANHEARLGNLEAMVTNHEARLGNLEAMAANHEARLGNLEPLVAAQEIRMGESEMQSQEHDAWLIGQDREQSGLVHDLAQVSIRLIKLNRRLDDLDRRISSPEPTHASGAETE
jgi:uncharacterized coiled-coil protein SlyX